MCASQLQASPSSTAIIMQSINHSINHVQTLHAPLQPTSHTPRLLRLRLPPSSRLPTPLLRPPFPTSPGTRRPCLSNPPCNRLGPLRRYGIFLFLRSNMPIALLLNPLLPPTLCP